MEFKHTYLGPYLALWVNIKTKGPWKELIIPGDVATRDPSRYLANTETDLAKPFIGPLRFSGAG